MRLKRILFTLFLTSFCVVIFSQEESSAFDTLKIEEIYHSPYRATLYSAVLPGLGQAYNKHYYKVPIIYALLASTAYLSVYHAEKYVDYRNGYADFIKEDGGNKSYENLEHYNPNYINNEAILEYLKNFHRRSRDLSVIGFVGAYLLNIIEANVSAHFLNYDIGEELVLNVQPSINTMNSTRLISYTQPVYGVTLNFKLK